MCPPRVFLTREKANSVPEEGKNKIVNDNSILDDYPRKAAASVESKWTGLLLSKMPSQDEFDESSIKSLPFR
jgi:hypothetical protein